MKKLLGAMTAIMIFAAPMMLRAQVEGNAGSMKIGVHFDATWDWSAESQKNPAPDQFEWEGTNSVTGQDLFVELSGMVGDRVSYKVLEGLVWETTSAPPFGGPGTAMSIEEQPYVYAAPQEAYIDFKIMDQLKFRFGKQVVPTLLANTAVHDMDAVHTARQPLIAENSSSSGPVGVNELIWDGITTNGISGVFPRVPLPLSVTGAAVIISFSGLELNYTLFDEWLEPAGFNQPVLGGPNVNWKDRGYDFNKTKGGDVALTYKGQLGPGKLAARFFYFDENTDLGRAATPGAHDWQADDSGWGLGLMYNADKFFLGAEYTSSTLKYNRDPVPGANTKSNTWYGYYVTVGGKFRSIQPVYRLDGVDYGNQRNGNFALSGLGKQAVSQCDTEMWHTIGVNYLFNDQVTVGLDYIIKSPEKIKNLKYPNSNELVLITELDLL